MERFNTAPLLIHFKLIVMCQIKPQNTCSNCKLGVGCIFLKRIADEAYRLELCPYTIDDSNFELPKNEPISREELFPGCPPWFYELLKKYDPRYNKKQKGLEIKREAKDKIRISQEVLRSLTQGALQIHSN